MKPKIGTKTKLVRYGYLWSINGKEWLGVVNFKTRKDAQDRFNTLVPTVHKRLVRHEIIRTELA